MDDCFGIMLKKALNYYALQGNRMKLFALVFVGGLLACEVSKPRNTSKNLCEGQEALSLQFADLIHHKAKYHGKLFC
jgi:hypothetical protein